MASDYLAFRSTCKRFLSICGLKGLHIKLNDWGMLLKWLVHAPDQVKRGVRADDQSPQHGQPSSPFFKLSHHLKNRSLSILPFVDITRTPQAFLDLHHLTKLCLAELSSLSFEMKCQECSIYMPELLLKCVSNVRHLKTIDSPQLPSILQSIDCANTHTPQPRTLCMKLFDGTSVLESVLDIIAGFCPQVTDLHPSMHEPGEPYVFAPCAYISDFPNPL
ncbi:hypothetical protein I204_01345 [Kwoniella mangroviensis CBS 8886]|nr:hypothetical protein I204_01345 [Kwoniella mangroviensis CBS 8886]